MDGSDLVRLDAKVIERLPLAAMVECHHQFRQPALKVSRWRHPQLDSGAVFQARQTRVKLIGSSQFVCPITANKLK